MDIKSVIILSVYFLFFVPPSYWVLKKVGVTQQLFSRSVAFGLAIAGLQTLLPTALVFVSFEYGYTVGVLVGLVLSYLYVNHVVHLEWYKNIGIVIFLPLVAGTLASPAMFLLFAASA